jgi:Fur family peroxide stress response transcriptional regulator
MQHIFIQLIIEDGEYPGGGGLHEPARTERIELYKKLCRERGERCTVQRRVILEAVLDLDNHPSADQIFDEVEARLPGVARTTVYRALDHLADMGVITKACHPGRVARFDPRLEIHHHLVCLRCNEFIDFEDDGLNALTMPDTSALGFEVNDYRVQLRGICQKCRLKEKKEEKK